MKLIINESGVWLDEKKIDRCSRVDVQNINFSDHMEVILRFEVEGVDMQHTVKGLTAQ